MTVTDRVGSSSLRLEADLSDAGDRRHVGWRPSSASESVLPALAGARRAVSDWSGQRAIYRWLAAGLDLTIVSAFTAVALAERTEQAWQVGLLAIGVGLFFVVVVGFRHGYDTRRAANGFDEFRAIGRGVLALAAVALTTDFVGAADLEVAPTVFGLVATGLCVSFLRLAQRSVARWLRVHGQFRRRTLVLGSTQEVATVVADLGDSSRHGMDLVGACLPEGETASATIDRLRVWGTVHEAAGLIEDNGIDVVIIASNAMAADEVRRLRWAIEHLRTEVLIAPSINEVLAGRLSLHTVAATPLLAVSTGPTRTQIVAKGVMDRVLSFLLLVLASPIIGVAAIAVRVTSPGAAIFRQLRIGADGQPFTMLKLRSMYIDAEARKAELASDGDKGGGAQFKLVDDPRITPVGAFIRRFSIDELPQLWNVVRGDMSLVGPRPSLPREVATYDVMAEHRLHAKPGLTGLWQVSGRSDLTWEEAIKLDLRYVDNWSIRYDLQILWRTARAVLGASGAY